MNEYHALPRIYLTGPDDWNMSMMKLEEQEADMPICALSVQEEDEQNVSAVGLSADEMVYSDCQEIAIQDRIFATPPEHRHVYSVSVSAVLQSDETEPDELDNHPDSFAQRIIARVNVGPNVPAFDRNGDEIDFTDRKRKRAEPHYDIDNPIVVARLTNAQRESILSSELLAQRWCIGSESAKRTLKATTLTGVRNLLGDGERKLRQRTDHLNYQTLKGKFYSDTMFAMTKSIRMYTDGQVYTDGYGFDFFYPMTGKGGPTVAQTLIRFMEDNHAKPEHLVTDIAPELISGEFALICRKNGIKRSTTVPHSPWKNKAEASVRELKTMARRMMRRGGAPKRLWCFALQHASCVRRHTALDISELQGRTPVERVLGYTPDVSRFALFHFFQPVRYIEPTACFPEDKTHIGYFLGIYDSCIDLMTFNILTKSGKIVARKSVWAIPDEDARDERTKELVLELRIAIDKKLGDSIKDENVNQDLVGIRDSLDEYSYLDFDAQEEDEGNFLKANAITDPDITPETYDEYLSAQVVLPLGGEMTKGTVTRRVVDGNSGNPIGKFNINPILDTRQYEVLFPDGTKEKFLANQIAENLYSQVDDQGRSYAVMKEITDHRSNGLAVPVSDGLITGQSGQQRKKITTRGWELQVKWKDGSSTWVPLKDLKESNPVELAEYARANKIDHEPAFAWWVNDVLRNRARIIMKIKTRYHLRTHKFGWCFVTENS